MISLYHASNSAIKDFDIVRVVNILKGIADSFSSFHRAQQSENLVQQSVM